MRRSFASLFLAILACGSVAEAQPPASMSVEVTEAYTAVKINILKIAGQIAEADYGYRPTPESESFAEVLDRIADSQTRTCAAVAGEQKTASAAGKKTKEEVSAALDEAFAECDKAFGSLSDANAGETVRTMRGAKTKLGTLVENVVYDSEQCGVLTVYLRLRGIIPPSRKRP